jgi:DNA-directed RNA polymerase specialized sigma24 family protein
MADRDAWEQPLYRFACLLLRDDEAARKIVLETIETGVKKRPAHVDPERLVMLQFQDVRRRALKSRQPATAAPASRGDLPAGAETVIGDADSRRLQEIVHSLPEPGRSAYALLLLDAMEAEWIAKLLGLNQADFAEAVQAARLAVHEALVAKPETAQQ